MLSKFSVNQDFRIEQPDLCPHNKIAINVQTVYRQEQPIRLETATHLKKLGATSCPMCARQNRVRCQCFSGSKGPKRDVEGGDGQEVIRRKDESIFSHVVTMPGNFSESSEEIFLNKGPTFMARFRESYRKSKMFLTGPRSRGDEMFWLMKPPRETVWHPSSEGEILNVPEKDVANVGTSPKKKCKNSSKSCYKPFTENKYKLISLGPRYPLNNLTSNMELGTMPPRGKQRNLLSLQKCGTMVEFFSPQLHLEDMQYREPACDENVPTQYQISGEALKREMDEEGKVRKERGYKNEKDPEETVRETLESGLNESKTKENSLKLRESLESIKKKKIRKPRKIELFETTNPKSSGIVKKTIENDFREKFKSKRLIQLFEKAGDLGGNVSCREGKFKSPQSFLNKSLKSGFGMAKPNTIPICYHHGSARMKSDAMPCELLPNEKVLFKNNHF